MTAFVAAGAGFLLAVLWFDLMHDIQVIGVDGEELPERVLASIAGYYRRVTTEAFPMNRLVSAAMLATISALVAETLQDDVDPWVAISSLVLVTAAVLVAAGRTVKNAVRLGGRVDPLDVQSRLARTILHDHLFCLVAVVAVLVVQLVFG